MFTPQMLLLSMVALIAIFTLPALINPRSFRKSFKSLFTDKDLLRLIGLLELLYAFIFLSVNYRFTDNWLALIAALGWLMVIDGTIAIWSPKFYKGIIKRWCLKSDKQVAVWAFMGVIFAVAICYVALNLIGAPEIIAY